MDRRFLLRRLRQPVSVVWPVEVELGTDGDDARRVDVRQGIPD
jgi:hypothetical protein